MELNENPLFVIRSLLLPLGLERSYEVSFIHLIVGTFEQKKSEKVQKPTSIPLYQ